MLVPWNFTRTLTDKLTLQKLYLDPEKYFHSTKLILSLKKMINETLIITPTPKIILVIWKSNSTIPFILAPTDSYSYLENHYCTPKIQLSNPYCSLKNKLAPKKSYSNSEQHFRTPKIIFAPCQSNSNILNQDRSAKMILGSKNPTLVLKINLAQLKITFALKNHVRTLKMKIKHQKPYLLTK